MNEPQVLLKVIQRVGGKDSIPVDVRIIAATHRDLEALIAEKQFPEDLYYRLTSVVIRLPPLRDRQEDIQLLAAYFCRRFSREFGVAAGGLQSDAINWLSEQPWPGNVRQLENVLRQALLFGRGYPISRENLATVAAKSAESPASLNTVKSIEDAIEEWLLAAKNGSEIDVHAHAFEAMERVLFRRAIELAQGNQAKAARWLNVSRQTIREKPRMFGLKEPHPNENPDDSGAPL